MKSLDEKLNKIRTNKYKPTDFIIADAKDGEMGGGAQAPGPKKGVIQHHMFLLSKLPTVPPPYLPDR